MNEIPEAYRSTARLAERLLRRVRLCKGADGIHEWQRLDMERALEAFLFYLKENR